MKNLSKKNEIISPYLNQLLSLHPVGDGVSPIWDPNGEFIYFQHSINNKKTISSINLNNGKIKKISDYKSGLAFLSSSMMTCSPDGQWLSYLNNEKKFVDRKSSNRKAMINFGKIKPTIKECPKCSAIVQSIHTYCTQCGHQNDDFFNPTQTTTLISFIFVILAITLITIMRSCFQ